MEQLPFGAQLREKNYVANRIRVSDDHYQAVYSDSQAPCGRHSVLQSPHKILIKHLGLLQPRFALGYLFLKAASLFQGVGKFTEGVGNLPSRNNQLESLNQVRVLRVATRQRGKFQGVVKNEGRLNQFVLYCFEWQPRWWERLINLAEHELLLPGEVERRFGESFDIEKFSGWVDYSKWPSGMSVYLMTRKEG